MDVSKAATHRHRLPCPPHFSSDKAAAWAELCDEMAAHGNLEPQYAVVMELYCDAYATRSQALAAVALNGYRTKHPSWNIAREAQTMLRDLRKELQLGNG